MFVSHVDLTVKRSILRAMKTADSQIIDALGGTVQVARVCKVTKAAVSQWRENGIPDARRMYLELLRPDVFKRSSHEREAA